MLASIVSGKEGESNYFSIEKRMQQLIATDNAIVEYLKLDHLRMKEHYESNYGSKKKGIVAPPQTGQVIGPQVDPILFKRYDNYKSAEFYADIALHSKYRNSQIKSFQNEIENEKSENLSYSEPVFLSAEGLVYPYQLIDQKENISTKDDFNTVMYNANFSDAFLLPPLPKPKPVIDLKMVEFVVYNKKEEIRSCYNSALRKNPHLSGEIKLSWMINEKGKAQNFKITNSAFQDKNLFRCIESRVTLWKFPKSKNGSYPVRFPFQFVSLKKKE